MHSMGLAKLVASAKRLLRCARWSLSLPSSSRATISAAPPLGHRMTGTACAVASTQNSPLTTPATADSTSLSLAVGSFSETYALGWASENMRGSSDTNSAYWSKTRLTRSLASARTASFASLSSRALGSDDVKLSSYESYRPAPMSAPIRATFASVGWHRYTAGTPAIGSRLASSSKCSVTPCLRSSWTFTSGDTMSRQKRSRTSTL
mmetsp:Transcript_22876/g.77851  ORF Transcript_22876/g.77851 Transcript_22876/m.77851 type:complete len:207 (+) Transcript_22876:1589-2209(+)